MYDTQLSFQSIFVVGELGSPEDLAAELARHFMLPRSVGPVEGVIYDFVNFGTQRLGSYFFRPGDSDKEKESYGIWSLPVRELDLDKTQIQVWLSIIDGTIQTYQNPDHSVEPIRAALKEGSGDWTAHLLNVVQCTTAQADGHNAYAQKFNVPLADYTSAIRKPTT